MFSHSINLTIDVNGVVECSNQSKLHFTTGKCVNIFYTWSKCSLHYNFKMSGTYILKHTLVAIDLVITFDTRLPFRCQVDSVFNSALRILFRDVCLVLLYARQNFIFIHQS